MGTDKHYLVLRGTDIGELESFVNLWISKGFEPAGGVAVDRIAYSDGQFATVEATYLQAMRLRAV